MDYFLVSVGEIEHLDNEGCNECRISNKVVVRSLWSVQIFLEMIIEKRGL